MTCPFDLVGIDHIVLRVRNLEKSIDFYSRVLGCGLERELPDIGLYQLRAGAQLIDLVPLGSELGGDGEPLPAHRNQDHFCLLIRPFDVEHLQRYLDQEGIDSGEVAERYGAGGYGPSLYVRDPDGNTIELKGAS
ncbi:MAG: VOC family protein [Pseudomonadales bacterium]|nr:VOC family protein [Pseudomonadales bacterium]